LVRVGSRDFVDRCGFPEKPEPSTKSRELNTKLLTTDF
jgi:hypothetical protein